MSDQGYGPAGTDGSQDPSGPAPWSDPTAPPAPSHGPSRPYGPPSQDQPPPYGQQPPAYGQQPPGQQYVQQPAQYGEPVYPTAQYPAAQYPNAQYAPAQIPPGQIPPGQYPAGQYGGYPPPGGGVPPAAGGGRRGLVTTAGVVVLAALATGGYFLFSSSSSSASPQKQVVQKLFEAGKTGDVTAARRIMCRADLAAQLPQLLGVGSRVVTYSIGSVDTVDAARATVDTTVRPTGGPVRHEKVTVVKEGGAWKVCLTQSPGIIPSPPAVRTPPSGAASVPSTLPSALPSALPSGLPSGLPSLSLPHITGVPSGLGSYCASTTSASTTAQTYIGVAEIGSAELAQACVYHDAVPQSVTESISSSGSLYVPGDAGGTGPVFRFATIDGKRHVAVTVTKEPDGHYYVTKVDIS